MSNFKRNPDFYQVGSENALQPESIEGVYHSLPDEQYNFFETLSKKLNKG